MLRLPPKFQTLRGSVPPAYPLQMPLIEKRGGGSVSGVACSGFVFLKQR